MSKNKKKNTLWTKIRESVLKEKISAQGNVVLLGDANCGKKSLINSFKRLNKMSDTTPQKMKGYYNTLHKNQKYNPSSSE